MIRPIEFFVAGEPKGQPRPRAAFHNGRARVYDPGTAENWKSQIALAAKPLVPDQPLDVPIKLKVDFYMPRPKAHFGKSGLKYGSPVRHTKKPDLDNLEKAVMDALTEVGIWRDDSLVCVKSTRKHYTDTQTPGANIIIEECCDHF